MNNLLNKLGVLNDDNKVSITNIAVMTFVLITAFRTLFSGAVINYSFINWKIDSVDLASTLPLLFSLLNYHGRRTKQNKQQEKKQESEKK